MSAAGTTLPEAEVALAQQGSKLSVQAQRTRVAVPEPEALIALIRSALIAIGQANETGNYTVLKDLGSPTFQAANSAARLGAVFSSLRDQRLDLLALAVITPQLVQNPTVDAQNVLRLVGYFPTRPIQVNFDLSFQLADGQWRHSALAIAAGPPALKKP